MARPVLTLAAVGVLGFAAWKVAALVMFPLLATLLKIALAVGLVFLVLWWLRKDKPKDDDAPAS